MTASTFWRDEDNGVNAIPGYGLRAWLTTEDVLSFQNAAPSTMAGQPPRPAEGFLADGGMMVVHLLVSCMLRCALNSG